MRTIKFRVWDVQKKIYLPEDAFAILNPGNICDALGNYCFGVMIKDFDEYLKGKYLYDSFHVLEQFTGLKDKDGVDVFEGDILSYPIEEMDICVIWDVSSGSWEFDLTPFDDNVDRKDWYFNIGIAKNSKIIGHIHNKD